MSQPKPQASRPTARKLSPAAMDRAMTAVLLRYWTVLKQLGDK